MATTKKIEPVKMTPTQMKKKIEALEEEIRVYKEDTDHNLYGNGCKRDLLFYGSVGTGTI